MASDRHGQSALKRVADVPDVMESLMEIEPNPKYLLNYLLDVVWRIEPPRRDHIHIHPRSWVDEPIHNGWIRTTCRVCGGFIGYRRVRKPESLI